MYRKLIAGEDPRKTLRNHRERGPKRFNYTYADVARLLGVSVQRVKNLTCGARPAFDPASLESVVAFVAERRSKR